MAEAFRWYESQQPGLGGDFILALDATFRLIQENPDLFPTIYTAIRRAFIRRFPYGIFYLVEHDRVVVLAVMHVRRDPGHWPGG